MGPETTRNSAKTYFSRYQRPDPKSVKTTMMFLEDVFRNHQKHCKSMFFSKKHAFLKTNILLIHFHTFINNNNFHSAVGNKSDIGKAYSHTACTAPRQGSKLTKQEVVGGGLTGHLTNREEDWEEGCARRRNLRIERTTGRTRKSVKVQVPPPGIVSARRSLGHALIFRISQFDIFCKGNGT